RAHCATRGDPAGTLCGHRTRTGARGDLSPVDTAVDRRAHSLPGWPPATGRDDGTDPAELAAARSCLPRRVAYHRDADEDRVSPRRGRAPMASCESQPQSGEMVSADWLEVH